MGTGSSTTEQELPQPSPPATKSNFSMRTAILLLLTFALAVNLAAGEVKPKSSKKGRKFCPKENKGDRCIAQENQYKCGVFSKELTRRPLTYIGILPDALTDDNQESWQAILGPQAKPSSFENFDCKKDADKRANSRCYSILNGLANKDLDSCGDSLFNSKGSGGANMGDTLCKQIHAFLKRIPNRRDEVYNNGIKDQEITFQYSQCGNDWTTVNSKGAPLTTKHKVCCHSAVHVEHPKQYYRCDDPTATKYECS